MVQSQRLFCYLGDINNTNLNLNPGGCRTNLSPRNSFTRSIDTSDYHRIDHCLHNGISSYSATNLQKRITRSRMAIPLEYSLRLDGRQTTQVGRKMAYKVACCPLYYFAHYHLDMFANRRILFWAYVCQFRE